jgi:hypothetical protein
MIDTLLHLPYVGYWLPLLAAFLVAAPMLWLVRPARAVTPVMPGGELQSGVPPVDAAHHAGTLQTTAPKYAPEQRRSFRRGGNSIGLYYTYPGQENGPAQASVVDRSIGGICVMTPEVIPIGTILTIRPINAEEMVPWVDAEVCTCRPGDDCYEVGCRFVKTPPYSILLLFG